MLLDDDLKTCGFRLLDESVATTNDEHDLIAVGVESQSTSQGDAPRPSLEAGHDLGHAKPPRHVRTSPPSSADTRPPSGVPGNSPRVTSRQGSPAVKIR